MLSNENDGSRRSEEAKKLSANVKRLDTSIHEFKSQCEKIELGVTVDFKRLQGLAEDGIITLGFIVKNIAVIAAIDEWDGRN